MAEQIAQAGRTAGRTFNISLAELAGANAGQRNDLLALNQAVYRVPDGTLYTSTGSQLVLAQGLPVMAGTNPLTGGIELSAGGEVVDVGGSPVSVTGTGTVGSVLTAAPAQGWIVTGYQWVRDGVAISGATGSTYTLVSDDAGKAVGCNVVGLSYSALALAIAGASVGGGAGGYLPVEHIILLGASIEVGTYDTFGTTELYSRIASTVPAAAGRVTLYNESVSGRPNGSSKADWDSTIRGKYSTGGATPLPYDSRTMVVFLGYGNDISNLYPYTTADDAAITTVRAQILAMIADCEARGWDWHVPDLSFRDYQHLEFEALGANVLPWVSAVSRQINLSKANQYKNRYFANGSSWFNLYSTMMRNASLLKDPVHPETGVVAGPLRQALVDSIIAPSWTGATPANTDFVLPLVGSESVGSQSVFTFGEYNKTASPNAARVNTNVDLQNFNYGRSDLARDRAAGNYLPWLLRLRVGAGPINSAGNTSLSVPGYFTGADLSQSSICSGTTVAKYAVVRLDPTKSYELVMSGSRGTASTDLTRMTRIDIVTGTPTAGGSTQQYSASNPASGTTANSVTFRVTPNASGIIEFEMSNDDRVSGGRFGYLGAVSVKRVA